MKTGKAFQGNGTGSSTSTSNVFGFDFSADDDWTGARL